VLEANTGRTPVDLRVPGLTGREREVLAHVERGLTNIEIARRMRIARPTVGRLLSNAMMRLGAESRAHAVMLASPVMAHGHAGLDVRSVVSPDRGRLVASPTAIGPEARALIGRIAAGDTLAEAAHALHLSRRTADRRLAQVRRLLGVERTVAAIVWARRLGWLE
jgi:DNA-binding CsgD family transcriptional regulator